MAPADEILTTLQAAWTLFSAYSLTEQLGISVAIAGGAYGVAVGVWRTACRAWSLAGGAAGLAGRGWRWATTALPVRDDVIGLLELMRDPSAWEFHGTTGVRHILNNKIIVADLRTALGESVVGDLNRRERKALQAARVELRGKLDRELAGANLAARLKV